MGLESWDDGKIKSMIANYEAKGVGEGGVYPLKDLKIELLRRTKSQFDTVALAQAIIAQSAAALDGLTTYKDLWSKFRPGEKWEGNKSQQIMGNALSRVVGYCVHHGLPILTVLVVRSDKRTLDPKAVTNIANDARKLGVDVGPDPDAFIERQREQARAVALQALPADDAGA